MNSENLFQESKIEKGPLLSKLQKEQLQWILIVLMLLGYALAGVAQTGLQDLNYQAESQFEPTIKDAVKLSDIPEIQDSVVPIKNITYGIASKPVFSKYEAQRIEAAKLQNEPLNKLYHSLLKLGYGPIYNMPYAELWLSNGRSKETAFGAHLKHFSSSAHLRDVGYSGFSDNHAGVFGKRFYKRHTLSGELNYDLNGIHYYGYDTSVHKLERSFTRQRYQLVEPKVQLVSHYNDSTHINHNLQLSYYNLQNLHKESENNVRFGASGDMFLNKEKLNINFLTDFYNNKQANDSFNDLIISLNPSFEANGKKWHTDMGLTGTLGAFKGVTRFYFYPQLNLHYDIYENLVIPYVGVDGGLIKNSFRSLSRENPFVDTTINYANTSKQYNLFGGLRGNLSSSTSYDARVSYARYNDLHFYMIDYNAPNALYNQFDLVYDDASVLTITGQLKYQLREKLHIIGKGNYFVYDPKTLTRAYHKPDYELTLSSIYNLQSKIILRADLFFFGQQWALSPALDQNNNIELKPRIIADWADLNLEAEYRYSKMLSFFGRINNIANSRYYRWERYPSQRFNLMLGLTFVPF